MLPLMKLSESTYISKFAVSDGGSALTSKLQQLDYSKYEVKEDSVKYLIGVLDRKVTSDFKGPVLRMLTNKSLRLILCKKKDGFPNFMLSSPANANGSIIMYVNIGAL